MKSIKRFAAVVIAIVAIATTASAQFRIGPRIGFNANSMHFNSDLFNSDNRSGFTGGLEAEVGLPLGLALDASLMYVRRTVEFTENDFGDTERGVKHCDYFEIPVNLKWKIGIPIVEKVVKPYLFTGPSFAFLTSRRAISDSFRNRSFDTSWQIGVGLELISHLQISANYGIGLNSALRAIDVADTRKVEGKNRSWTVTAAWLF